MNQQPDKFFRDKLQNYDPPVPPAAWNRVAGNLKRKNNTGLFLRIAAALLLLATGTLLIYPVSKTDDNKFASATSETAADTSATQRNNETDDQRTQPARDGENTPPQTAEDAGLQKHEPDKAHVTKRKENPLATQLPEPALPITVITDKPEQYIAALETEVQQTAEQHQEPQQGQTTTRKSVTIVFSAEEVNQKYLAKKQEPEATDEQPQASGLKKLLDKAYDLKHNQDLLGSLRQKKNEILALNFRNEKETTRND